MYLHCNWTRTHNHLVCKIRFYPGQEIQATVFGKSSVLSEKVIFVISRSVGCNIGFLPFLKLTEILVLITFLKRKNIIKTIKVDDMNNTVNNLNLNH